MRANITNTMSDTGSNTLINIYMNRSLLKAHWPKLSKILKHLIYITICVKHDSMELERR